MYSDIINLWEILLFQNYILDNQPLKSSQFTLFYKIVGILLVFIASSHNQYGQQAVEIQRILPSDLSSYSFFGSSMSVGTQFAAFGAYHDDKAVNSGSVYLYVRSGDYWVPHSKLYASDARAHDYFGMDVCLENDYLLAGCAGDDGREDNAGSVYVFHYEGQDWVEKDRFTASNGNTHDLFGQNISIHGSYAIISAQGRDDHGAFSGAAYIFHRQGERWVEQAMLTASDAQQGDNFGNEVAITDKYAFVGAYYEDEFGYRSGAVYVFSRNGNQWVEQQKLTNMDGLHSMLFGCSISVDNDLALIGAVGGSTWSIGSGAVYAYQLLNNRWEPQQRIVPLDGKKQDHFGNDVHLNGHDAIVGSYADDDLGDESGSAYLFRYDGSQWIEKSKLTASDGGKRDSFGNKVYISPDYALVNAELGNGEKTYTGAVYHFSFTEDPPTGECDYLHSRLDLGPEDTVVCGNETLTLDPQVPLASYRWSTGSTSSSIQVATSATYWVEVSQGNCIARDSITVDFVKVDLGNDRLSCHAVDHSLAVDYPYGEVLWSTREIGQRIKVSAPGEYWVEVTTNGCTLRDSIRIKKFMPPDLGADTVFCEPFNHTLRVPQEADEILWSTGQTASKIQVTQPGDYWVRLKVGNCVAYDTIRVTSKVSPLLAQQVDTLLCQGESYHWSPDLDGFTYYWEDGNSERERIFDQEGTYQVTLQNECYTMQQSIAIEKKDCSCDVFIPTIFTPNSDGMNDLFGPALNGNISHARLLVYNRWGRLVYQDQEQIAWNGRINDKKASTGIYYWVLQYQCQTRKGVEHKYLRGNLTLLR